MMDIVHIAGVLASARRLAILRILNQHEMSAMEVYAKFKIKGTDTHRETIYRDLERLVEFEIVSKYYNQITKKIVYKLSIKEITIDLQTLKISIQQVK